MMKHMLHRWLAKTSHECRDEEGAASVEMALCSTLVLIMFLPLMDVAQMLYTSLQLDSCVRSGVQYALSYPDDTSGIQAAIQNGSAISSASITAGAAEFCECNGTTASCASSCAGTMATYRTISASYNMPLLVGYPGFANPYPISRQISIRVE